MDTTHTHEHLDDLRETTRAVSSTHLAVDSQPNPALDRGLWDELDKLGFVGLCAPEAVGGTGGDLLDAATVLAELTTARIPFAEAAIVAAPALGRAALDLPSGPFTAAHGTVTIDDEQVSGRLDRVPFARDCDSLVLLEAGEQPALRVISLRDNGISIVHGENLAGEPRDTVTLRQVSPVASAEVTHADMEAWQLRGALARAVASAGVAAAIVDQTASYVSERVQFGRPLMKFQVVQHAVAKMAADATAMQTAATAATLAMLDESDSAEMLVAAAKAETALMSRPVTAAAHQAHGAIGFTREHVLGALTTRLWAWREEYGNERYWHQRLGELAQGQDLWRLVTGQ
ncbi:acyl-CoA dehydrogenase family protein [Mycolicibacterium litorale]|uniref:acyl-CoA dehydrogenase family protein n=1 Tax=Mycolicibacterium litorale TaxID=758802 RepID=UPI0010D21CA6|nr:acyl-CoA dehydrogenase family protein [Mycolicibacterium litorale]TDY09638.1 acyl-CoA dehydrogenase [Mycolicibacterium litorale]